jgi:tetratricopeptide (TPR) repeat protein
LGCNSGGKKKPTQKQAAVAQWNNARAAVLLSLAQDQYKTGNFDKSRQTLTDAMKMAPENAAMWVLSGKLNIEQGQLESAERDLRQAITLTPNAAEPHYLLGVVYQRWQRLDKALAEYETAASAAPNELAYVLARAETLVALDRTKEALSFLQEKLATFDNSPVIRDLAGQLLMQQGQHREAVEMFRTASLLATEDLGLKERWAVAMFYDKQYRESADLLARILRDERTSARVDLTVMHGEALLHLDRVAEARSVFETAAVIAPESPLAWQGVAKAALESGDLRRADFAVKKAVALDIADAQSHLLLGYVRMRQGKTPEAVAAFKKASALDPKDPVSLCMTGFALEQMGKKAEAMQCYANALRLSPNDELASQLLAGVDTSE